MSALFFWKTWPAPDRRLYVFSLGLLLASLLFFGVAWARGLDNVLHWDVLSELGEIPFALERVDGADLPVTAYTVTEQLVASPMALNEPAADAFAVCWGLGLLLALTAVTTLRRTGFTVGTGLFIVTLVTLNLDALAGRTDRLLTLGVVALYAGLAFYFNAFRPSASLSLRFGAFLGLTALLAGLGLWRFPQVALHVATYAQPAALIGAGAVIFLVSFEVINGFLYLVTRGGSGRALLHFAVLSGIYLLNLLLVYLHNVRSIDWNLLYLSPFLLLVVSVLLGVWGLRRQAVQAPWVEFAPAGALLYAGLAAAALATGGYAFATANDPLTEVLEDAVVYSHLVMGALYVLYVVVNFGQVLNQGLDAWKVVYKPLHWPLGIYRGGALVGMAMLLAANHYFPFYQALAGQYNGLGDLERARSDYRAAEAYYQTARQFEFQNHKTAYALASLALIQGDPHAAGFYFKEALRKNPSDYAYGGLARMQAQEGLFFDALFTLREGFQRFPRSGALAHDLAYQFGRTDAVDSTMVYYEKATRLGPRPELAETNRLAFWLRHRDVNADSLARHTQPSDYVGWQANFLALNVLRGQLKPAESPHALPADSTLGTAEFAYFANDALHRFRTGKGRPVDFAALARLEANAAFFDDLQYLDALQHYYFGDKLVALDRLEGRASADTAAGSRWRMAFKAVLKKEETAPATPDELARVRTVADAESLLRRHPLDPAALDRATALLNERQHAQRAYDALLAARRYRPADPAVTQLYIRQCLRLNLPDYAADALTDLQRTAPTAYAAFLPVYQAQVALIEKQREGFH
jgi:tetratricopeptide (TPR) repeat protein